MATLFVIGDIHGRLDLLEAAFEALRPDLERGARLLCLGDYVDRGPDSRGVVEFLLGAAAHVTCLKGNHEALMAQAYRSREGAAINRWLRFGGLQTLQSYGWRGGEPDLSVIPERHIDWIEQLPSMLRDDHRVYVHAGLRPGVPIEQQDEDACLWIREPFLRASASKLAAYVVHGHTPSWDGKPEPALPEVLAHRTNLDTGAYATGVLSIGVFDPEAPGPPLEIRNIVSAPMEDAWSGAADPPLGPAAVRKQSVAVPVRTIEAAPGAAQLDRRPVVPSRAAFVRRSFAPPSRPAPMGPRSR